MNLNTGGWASAAQRLIARLRSDGLNSTTPVTEINGGTISAPNADIALVAKGTGATLAQVPDGTAVGGNKRERYATDWQKLRLSADQVASGYASAIGGGEANKATSSYSFVGGGQSNTAQSGTHAVVVGGSVNTASGQHSFIGSGNNNLASSTYSFVGGGQNNAALTATHATVCGGSSNTASGAYAIVCGGQNSTASSNNSFIGGGINHAASGIYSTVVGGNLNTANSGYSFIAGGRSGIARSIEGYHVFPACVAPIATAQGCTQSALLLLGRQTTDATATVLTSNTSAASTTNQVILPNNSAYYFRGSVISGVTGGGDSKAWTFEGAIKRGATAASTTIVGTVVVNVIAFDAGASAWTIAVTADTTNGGLAVTFTGAAATTIRTVAKIETTEMTY